MVKEFNQDDIKCSVVLTNGVTYANCDVPKTPFGEDSLYLFVFVGDRLMCIPTHQVALAILHNGDQE